MSPRWRISIAPLSAHPSRRVRVLVFDTLAEMRAYALQHGGVTYTKSGRGLTSRSRYRNAWGVTITDPSRRPVATVLLAKQHCYPQVACHEFQHATMEYLRRYIIRRQSREGGTLVFGPIGEELAYFNGNLNAEFYRVYDARIKGR